eukprot:CAMPEP_0180261648 /NCGR_PEP_ID=MMETSP0987-20121128/44260_1 /TAXON_ID=697907 /ORGANISM="non described non described, Strain CCMP2293" /LENGTH=48 /DNA_ID= /DNA_START= /DNA_END= /DNA_ORIENTATION=
MRPYLRSSGDAAWAQLRVSASSERRKNMTATARPRDEYLSIAVPFIAP